jgi:hypothetical protein
MIDRRDTTTMRPSPVRIVLLYALVGAVLGCSLGWILRPSNAELRHQAQRLVPPGFSTVDIVHEPTNILLAQRQAVLVEARGAADPSDTTVLAQALESNGWRVSGLESRPNGGQVDGRNDGLRAFLTTVGDRSSTGQFTRLTVRVNRDPGGAARLVATTLGGAALLSILGWLIGHRQQAKRSSNAVR